MIMLEILPELIAMGLAAIYVARSYSELRRARAKNSISNAVRVWTLIQEDRRRTRAGVYLVRK